MLVCRAVLGRSFVTDQQGDFSSKVTSEEYGHVLGDREKAVGTFREFVFFHEASIYPEYAVFYRRVRAAPMHPPPHWTTDARTGKIPHALVESTAEESVMMQGMLNSTFRRGLDDNPEGQPLERFEVVSCLRSECPALWDAFAKRRQMLMRECKGHENDFVTPATMQAQNMLDLLTHPKVGNPSNQSFLLMGVKPSAAKAQLGQPFSGGFLVEGSSVADTYANAFSGGTFDGLCLILVYRAMLGRSLVVSDAGDVQRLLSVGGAHSVVLDRGEGAGSRQFHFKEDLVDGIYPEFAVLYRRVPAAAPAQTRMT